MDILIKTKQNSPDSKIILLYFKDTEYEIGNIQKTLDLVYFEQISVYTGLSQINLIHYIANNFDQCFEEFQANPNYILQKDVDGDWYSHSINSRSVLFAPEKDKGDISTVIDIEGLTEDNTERMHYMYVNICIGIKNSRDGECSYYMYSKEGISNIDSFIKEVREMFFPIGRLDSICAEQIQQLAIKYFSALKGKDKDLMDAYIDRLGALASIWWDNNAKLYNVKGFDEKLYGDDLCFLYYNNPDKKEVTNADKDIELHNKVGNGNILGKEYVKEVKTVYGDREMLGKTENGSLVIRKKGESRLYTTISINDIEGISIGMFGELRYKGCLIPLYKSDSICGKENSPTSDLIKKEWCNKLNKEVGFEFATPIRTDVYIEEGLQFNYYKTDESDTLYTISKIEDDEVVVTWGEKSNQGSTTYELKDVQKYFAEGIWIPCKKKYVSIEDFPEEDDSKMLSKLEHPSLLIESHIAVAGGTERLRQKVYEWWINCSYGFILANSNNGVIDYERLVKLYIENNKGFN